MIRKIISMILVLCLLAALPMTAEAASKKDIELYAQSMIRYYRFYQEEANHVIRDLADQMAGVDPQQAATWEKLMLDWSWVNAEMPICEDVLPDGLPQDDSLCIVVMGFGLKEDGSMKEELIDRLVVALSSAVKYPNAYIAVTGGQTSQAKGVTEAGQMAAWLQKKGVDKSRIITEKQALSTTANAINTYKLLNKSYPQINSIALISSDYHITWSAAMFTTVSAYKAGYEGGRRIELLASAVCDTGTTADTFETQVWGVCAITGIPYEEKPVAPTLYEEEIPQEPIVTEAEALSPAEKSSSILSWNQDTASEVPAKETRSPVPVLLIAALAAAVYIFTPKKPRKKRKKPEFKWE